MPIRLGTWPLYLLDPWQYFLSEDLVVKKWDLLFSNSLIEDIVQVQKLQIVKYYVVCRIWSFGNCSERGGLPSERKGDLLCSHSWLQLGFEFHSHQTLPSYQPTMRHVHSVLDLLRILFPCDSILSLSHDRYSQHEFTRYSRPAQQ